MKWEDKIDKAIWRGTGQFNSVGNIALRPNLLEATKGKSWADVELLEWGNNGVDAKNAIGIEDFCRYKYIIYTEVRILLLVALCSLQSLTRYSFRGSLIPGDCLSTQLATLLSSLHHRTTYSTQHISCALSSQPPSLSHTPPLPLLGPALIRDGQNLTNRTKPISYSSTMTGGISKKL